MPTEERLDTLLLLLLLLLRLLRLLRISSEASLALKPFVLRCSQSARSSAARLRLCWITSWCASWLSSPDANCSCRIWSESEEARVRLANGRLLMGESCADGNRASANFCSGVCQ